MPPILDIGDGWCGMSAANETVGPSKVSTGSYDRVDDFRYIEMAFGNQLHKLFRFS